jgi:hypothetical protein
MATPWTPEEMNILQKQHEARQPWDTDYTLAGRLASVLQKSPEAIRWQLRQYHRVLPKVSYAKILLLDIETLPLEGKLWGPWNQNLNPVQLKKDWSIVCWSAKWLFDSKVKGEAVSGQEAIARQDQSVLGTIWQMMNEAHIIITHNGDDFDLKKLNTRFLLAGMPPPMCTKSIDTLKVLRQNFAFTYNKLDEVAKCLGMVRKIETSFKWWDECSDGDEKRIKQMLKYNKQDVNVLEELYLRLRPWMKKHPNMNLFAVDDAERCPNCGDMSLNWGGTYMTPTGLYGACRCEACGALGRSTKKKYNLKGAVVQG